MRLALAPPRLLLLLAPLAALATRPLAPAWASAPAGIACSGCGCTEPSPKDERERAAALADRTSRQLVAALNARSRDALQRLLVITSTSGGPPRPLRGDEVGRIVHPDPPFELLGAGRPGTMLFRDGAQAKRSARLIVRGDDAKILATSERLSAYLAREAGGTQEPPADPGVRVVSFLSPEP